MCNVCGKTLAQTPEYISSNALLCMTCDETKGVTQTRKPGHVTCRKLILTNPARILARILVRILARSLGILANDPRTAIDPQIVPHSMADVIPFFNVFNVFINSLRIQRFDKTKRKYISHTNKENSICNIVLVLMFQQLLANKHHGLRDSEFGREEAWVWSPTKKTRSVRFYDRAFKI